MCGAIFVTYPPPNRPQEAAYLLLYDKIRIIEEPGPCNRRESIKKPVLFKFQVS
jgi:hypothetical protein